jgi:hypothetical protein
MNNKNHFLNYSELYNHFEKLFFCIYLTLSAGKMNNVNKAKGAIAFHDSAISGL